MTTYRFEAIPPRLLVSTAEKQSVSTVAVVLIVEDVHLFDVKPGAVPAKLCAGH